jgi:hypothetical protein
MQPLTTSKLPHWRQLGKPSMPRTNVAHTLVALSKSQFEPAPLVPFELSKVKARKTEAREYAVRSGRTGRVKAKRRGLLVRFRGMFREAA